MIMFWPHLIVYIIEGENDGLLTPEAVKWGDFRGVIKSNTNRGISHCDEVDLRRQPLNNVKGEGISDITDFYVNVVAELKDKGY